LAHSLQSLFNDPFAPPILARSGSPGFAADEAVCSVLCHPQAISMPPEQVKFPQLDATTAILAALLLLAAIQVVYYMAVLPDQVLLKPGNPASGTISKWSQLALFLAVGALPVLLFFWLPRLILRRPDGIKIPNRDYWLAPERQQQTANGMAMGTRILALWLLACIMLLFDGGFEAQLNPRGWGFILMLVGIVGVPLSGLGMALWLGRFDRVPKEHQGN
jgi:hypothetical protein